MVWQLRSGPTPHLRGEAHLLALSYKRSGAIVAARDLLGRELGERRREVGPDEAPLPLQPDPGVAQIAVHGLLLRR
jgi:hypothetical protein